MSAPTTSPQTPLRGRRCVLTPEAHERIVQAMQLGSPVKVAAGVAGVTETTFYRWMQQGRADIEAGTTSIFRDLCEAVEHARHHGDVQLLASVRGQTQGRRCRTCAGTGTLRSNEAGGRENDQRLVTCAGCKGSGFATQPDGRLALEMLSRRHPAEFARKQRHQHEHTGQGGGPVRVDVTVAAVAVDLVTLAPDQLAALAWSDSDDDAPPAAMLPPPRDVIDAAPAGLGGLATAEVET